MLRPPPLPTPVPFPVYGLADRYAGPRNIILWNQPDYLWTVSLTHGELKSGDVLAVETSRQQRRADDASGTSAPPPGEDLAWAALAAVSHAIDLEPARGRAARQTSKSLLESETALIEVEHNATVGSVQLRGWADTTVSIDGASVPGFRRTILNALVTVMELPEVVLSIVATGEFMTDPMELADVRDGLDDYTWPSISPQPT